MSFCFQSTRVVLSLTILFLVSQAVNADFTVFTDQLAFETAAQSQGSVLLGMEDFENSNVGLGETAGRFGNDSVLEFRVPLLDGAGNGFRNGLASDLVRIRSAGNLRRDLVILGEGNTLDVIDVDFIRAESGIVGALDFFDSTVIDIVNQSSNAVGFDLLGSDIADLNFGDYACLLYTSPSPRDQRGSRMPSSA